MSRDLNGESRLCAFEDPGNSIPGRRTSQVQKRDVPKEKGGAALVGEEQAMKLVGHTKELEFLISANGHEWKADK